MKIAVVGSINMDLVSHVHHLPKAGETIASHDFMLIPGGKGANQAVAAARLGAHVSMIGMVGEDENGTIMLAGMTEAQVHVEGIKRSGTTGMAFINVSDDGENNIVLVPGANAQVSIEHINENLSIIEQSDVVLLQLEIPLHVVEYVVKKAAALGKLVILNPAPAKALSQQLLQHVHTLTPNETELASLSGLPVTTPEEAGEAARKLLASGPRRIIVTLGEKGALLVTEEKTVHVPACRVEPVDTTAAGDSFTAAFAVGMAKGMSDVEAAGFASKVAAIVVTRRGAQPSLPTLAEVEAHSF
ncbi:ribokinase [Brevibacillus parabrevis]|uniref:ribokinase n=1 Tax=Brevibacillus parabrevis TaxID=54914 RepID=UPI0007AB65A2|nr:ribokinase [Brevibacillus parabrevis]KZE52234.1 ribokinase [Brevibacillus parabrevis]